VHGQVRRGLGIVAVALVASAGAGGCGGGGEKDLTSGKSPEEILEESRAAASAVEFYRPKLTLSLDLTAAPGAEGFAALATGPVTITAERPVRRPISESGPAFSFDTTASLPLTLSLDVLADVSGFVEEAEIVAPANPEPFDLGSILPGLGL
jgi:hypothetical protein